MAYRLPGGRITLDLEEHAGLRVEIEPIGAWPVYYAAVGLASAYWAAATPAAEFGALSDMFTHFCVEAQPTWEVIDHRGVVPATPAGMMRLPLALALAVVTGWVEEFVAVPPSTAVDEIYPPGALRDQLNAVLARKKAEAA